MRNITAILLLCLVGLPSTSVPAFAQQKTAADCRAEWKANKADNQAKGITEKAYVAQCHAGGTGSSTLPSAAGASASTPAAPAAEAGSAQQKTAADCRAEWKANKADNQAKGMTEKAYVAQCRAGGASGSTTSTTAGASAPTPAQPAAPPAPAAAAPKPAATATATPTGAGEFAAETQAKSHCPSDTVVWANLKSKVYHFSGNRDYGNTKSGAYMCEKDALGQGFRASKVEKHPA
jgi:hypothetical protein